MVWTVITRCEHTRRYARYPSDLTDNEWGVVVPFVPPGRGGGRPRTTDMREVLNAILYLAEGGIAWRMLDRVPRSGVRALRSTRLPAGRAGTFRLPRWAA